MATEVANHEGNGTGSIADQPRFHVPEMVSAGAKESLPGRYALLAAVPRQAAPPASLDEWTQMAEAAEAYARPHLVAEAAKLPVAWREDVVGGIPVVRVAPVGGAKPETTLIYAHGGGYITYSAKSCVVIPALVAAASGREVVSVDYTLAPHGNWRTIPNEVIAVYQALLASGHDPRGIGMLGDSAGGGLIAGSVLKMRDDGLPLPGALYLLSPWADVTGSGDTWRTLADADPMLDVSGLSLCSSAYAQESDQAHPYVSPVNGDFSLPFPPTLVQGGTREILLSDCIRLYQAIRSGPNTAILDLYEGMPHVWQMLTPWIPETGVAIRRAAAFLDEQLARQD